VFRRASEPDLTNCRFQEGDVSLFGAMFAPRPDAVAREMVRVTRPGGHTVMGNWIPNDPTLVAHLLRISAAYTPPPPAGFVSPMLWDDPAVVAARLGRRASRPSASGVTATPGCFAIPTRRLNYSDCSVAGLAPG